MTNPITTLSRERLEQLADENTICKVSWDERIEMARALLAVMDAKPIGYFRDDARAVFRVWPTKSDDCNVPVYTTPPAPSAPDGWIKCSDRMPEEAEKNYQVVALCSKKYDEGNYIGEQKTTIVQDWVIRRFPHGFTHWMPLPAAPGGDE